MSVEGAIERRYHRFGRVELLVLAMSYQRYALLLGASSGALASSGAWLVWAGHWFLGGPLLLAALPLGSFCAGVSSRLTEKMRITAVAQRRIDAGRFEPEMVQDFCGDPCFRVMAREVLRRSGLDRKQAAALVSHYRGILDEESGQTLIIDHTQGRVFKIEGDQTLLINSQLTPEPHTGDQGISS
jgi:hypothetical protein